MSIGDWKSEFVPRLADEEISNDQEENTPQTTGTSQTESVVGSEVETKHNQTSVAHLSEKTQAVREETGSTSIKEEETAEEQSESKTVAPEVETRVRTGSTVQTTASVTSRRSTTKIVRLPAAVNKTEEQLEKKIQKALSGAIFEAAEGGDVRIEAKKTTDIITSAYADLLVAAGATAESDDAEEVCEEVLTKVAPKAITASVRTALEAQYGSPLPLEVELDLVKIEQASVSVEGTATASACADIGKSDAEGILTAAAYDETISSIVEDILHQAKGSSTRSSEVESETTAEFTDITTSTVGESEGSASGSSDVEGGVGAESIKLGESEATDVTGFSEEEETHTPGTKTEVSTATHTSVGGEEEPEGSSEGKGKHKGPVPTEPTETSTEAAQHAFSEEFDDIFEGFGSEGDIFDEPTTTTTTTTQSEPRTLRRQPEPLEDYSSVTICRTNELVRCCQRRSYICSCGLLDDGSMCTAKLTSSGGVNIYDIRADDFTVVDKCRCP